MAIYFYGTQGELGYLSNFSLHGFELDGHYWQTVEHYFQAKKFPNTAYEEKIRLCATPKLAKSLGRSRSVPLRPDWEEVKEAIMFDACLKKFQTHADIRALLLETHNEPLVENAPTDYYWGIGKSGSGKNRLGFILENVRTRLRENS